MALESVPKNELEKLKEENEQLKKKLNPLSEKESARLKELHGLVASTISSDPNFPKLTKEYLELSARVVSETTTKLTPVSNSRKIGG